MCRERDRERRTDKEHLLCPVVLDGVHGRLGVVPALAGLRADALVRAERVPRELVHHPEVWSLVQHSRLDVSNACHHGDVFPQATGCFHVINLPAVVRPVAERARAVVGRERLEAEGVRLLADEDLVHFGRPGDTPVWLCESLGIDGGGVGHHLARRERDGVVGIAGGDAAVALAGAARRAVVGVVAPVWLWRAVVGEKRM